MYRGVDHNDTVLPTSNTFLVAVLLEDKIPILAKEERHGHPLSLISVVSMVFVTVSPCKHSFLDVEEWNQITEVEQDLRNGFLKLEMSRGCTYK